MTLGERIKLRRKELGLTQVQLGEMVHKSSQVISNWERGYTTAMSPEDLQNIARALNVNFSELMDNRASAQPTVVTDKQTGKGVRIPVLGRVVAGIPIEAIEEIIDWEEIPQRLAASGKFFALRVCGHSMEPKILEGDVVIVRQQDDVDNGDIAIVLVNGDEATVKHIKKQAEGITLIATNISVYEPHFYSNQEIRDLPVRVIGKVVELRRKL